MVDLQKLQERFDKLFETETAETFEKWLSEKRKKDLLRQLGKGRIEELVQPLSSVIIGNIKPATFNQLPKDIVEVEDNSFAMAA